MSGDHLCEGLVFEIFTRLPLKSIVRFRSLSKALCSCIASPKFIRMHTSRSPQKVLITHYYKRDDKYGKRHVYYTLHSEDQLPLCPSRGYIDIKAVEFPFITYPEFVGSCNGIICLFEFNDLISLWNPSIRRKLTLPYCRGRCYCVEHRVGIRFGLGFDLISDAYKIVSLPNSGGARKTSYVYSTKTGIWCAIASPTPLYCKVTSRGCSVNGALHWVVQRRRFPQSDHYILTFDLSSYIFGTIELPEPSWETERLTTIDGSLAVISTENGDSWIWVMRERSNTVSWSVFFRTKTDYVEARLQRVLQLKFFHTFCEWFHVYDRKKGAQSRLVNLNAKSDIRDLEICTESLQLFDMGTSY